MIKHSARLEKIAIISLIPILQLATIVATKNPPIIILRACFVVQFLCGAGLAFWIWGRK